MTWVRHQRGAHLVETRWEHDEMDASVLPGEQPESKGSSTHRDHDRLHQNH